MSDPHNHPGEVWPQHQIDACLAALQPLKSLVIVSGGWAWHFMSLPGHVEYKQAHDHKDIDLVVPPRTVFSARAALQEAGFDEVTTEYDGLYAAENFRRYGKLVEDDTNPAFRLTIDLFIRDVPALQCPGGWLVVSPEVLLGYYSRIHPSKSCWAVLAAQKILAGGSPPETLVGDKRLTEPSYKEPRE